ncbi:MAG: hypothetical protein ABSB63_23155 [Spirochaetia bacterium]|jgi:hypothetical protein
MVDEQYVAAHIAAYPADKGRVLVSNRSTSHPDLLSEQLFGILRQADRFDTIAGHVKRLLAAGWEDDGSGFIKSAFLELIARGLLVPKSSFQASLLEKADRRETPPLISSVIIPTRDRIPQLQRCLGSWIENNKKHDRHPDYIVLDDSRQKNQDTNLREILTPFTAGGTRVSFAGMEEKTGFVDELVRAAMGDGLPGEVVTFALFGDEEYTQTYGANRNALLLDTAGELIVMTDDDTLPQPAVLGESGATLALSSMKDPTITRFHADRRQLVQSVRTTDVDILSWHEKVLGRSIAGCMSALGPDSALEMECITPESVHFFGKASKVVKASAAGHWGDSGMDSPYLLLELVGKSRDLLLRSEKLYAQARESREIFRSVPCYTISGGSVFMAINAGIDNRSLLPPFLPVGRNEDGLFAMTLHLCAEDALIGHVPLAVLHSPQEARHYEQGASPIAAPRLAEIMQTILNTFNPSPGHAGISERLSDLGELFVDVGSLKIEDFREYIETVWVAAASRYIGYLEYLLDLYHGEPDYWAEDVLSFIERLTDFTVHQSAAAPRELLATQSPEQAMETCRRVVRQYGELLQWWPVIYGAAGALREAGIRLARPI